MEFIVTGQRVLHLAEKYDKERAFYRPMNNTTSANDAVANDVKYLLICWAAAKQCVAIIDKFINSLQEINAKPNVIGDIEIISILQTELSDPSDKVESKYRHLLVKHCMLEKDLHKSCKEYLKKLIKENLENFTYKPHLEQMNQITCVVWV